MNNEDDSSDPFEHLPEGHPSRDRSYTVGKHRPPTGSRFPPGSRATPRAKGKASMFRPLSERPSLNRVS